MDNDISVVDSVRISKGLPGYTAPVYILYVNSVGCDDVKALETIKREIAAQRYLTALLFRWLNKQRFSQLKQIIHNSYVLGQALMHQYFR